MLSYLPLQWEVRTIQLETTVLPGTFLIFYFVSTASQYYYHYHNYVNIICMCMCPSSAPHQMLAKSALVAEVQCPVAPQHAVWVPGNGSATVHLAFGPLRPHCDEVVLQDPVILNIYMCEFQRKKIKDTTHSLYDCFLLQYYLSSKFL